MSGTIADIAQRAKSDVERFAAEAHRDVERFSTEAHRDTERFAEEARQALAPKAVTAPGEPLVPDPLTLTQFKQAFDTKVSVPAKEAPATQAPPGPSKINLPKAKIVGPEMKGGFGTVSWIDTGVTDAPSLVIKQPNTPKDEAMLEKEAKAYEKVGQHPNIARCLGMQTIGGQRGLVIEGIKGDSMTKAMDRLEKLYRGDKTALQKAGRTRALSHEEYVGTLQYMVTQILQGLVYLEKQGVAHNDIRPDNVMCDAATGEVKIVDFGLSFDVGRRPDGVQMPVGHGSAAPELATHGAQVTGKADVFSAGEIARKGMEKDQFRYNTDQFNPTKEDAQAFAKQDAKGGWQQSLNKKPDPPAPSVRSTLDERLADACARLSELIADPFIASTENAERLTSLLRKIPAEVEKAKGENNTKRAGEIVAGLEEEVRLYEERLKRSGTYVEETQYVKFVNSLMHPEASLRLSAEKALQHPFLAQRLLDDAAAQAVLKPVLAGLLAEAQKDNSGGSAASGASGTSILPLNAPAELLSKGYGTV